MSHIIVNETAVGIPVADQLERAHEIARWVRNNVTDADAEYVGMNPATWESTIPPSNRIYIAGLDGASGAGTVSDPIRVGAGSNLNVTALRDAMLDAVANRTGDIAIYIDNTIDTSTSTAVMQGMTIDTGALADKLHLIAWDRVGNDPHRLVVFDAFRPLSQWVTGYSGFTDAGGGVWTVTLDSVSPLPNMIRVGPAGQHMTTSGYIYKVTNVANIDQSAFGLSQYHLDAGTRLLSIRMVDGSDPSSLDIRMSNRTDGIRTRGLKVYTKGFRVSGYDSTGGGSGGYNWGQSASTNGVYILKDIRADFGVKHIIGLAYGSGANPRLTHYDCEFGFGENPGSGYTGSVSYSDNSGSSEIGFNSLCNPGTIRRQAGQMTILHSSGSDSPGSAIYICPRYTERDEGAMFSTFMNHQGPLADAYSVFAGALGVFKSGKGESRFSRSLRNAWNDFTLDYEVRGDQSFAGISFSTTEITQYHNSHLKIGGVFNPNANNANPALYTRGGANTFVNQAARLIMKGSVLDFSTWDRTGTTGYYRTSLTNWENANNEPMPPMIDLTGVMVRAPHSNSTGWCWFSNGSTIMQISNSDLTNLQSWSNCAFVGTFPADQTPASGVTTYTEGDWAALNPTALNSDLATAWLIDQRNLLAAVRQSLNATRQGKSVFIKADPKGTSTGCVVAVSVTPTDTPDDAALLAGIVGTAKSDETKAISLNNTSGYAFIFAYYEDEDMIRAAAPIHTESHFFFSITKQCRQPGSWANFGSETFDWAYNDDYEFPLGEGDRWHVTRTATVAGTDSVIQLVDGTTPIGDNLANPGLSWQINDIFFPPQPWQIRKYGDKFELWNAAVELTPAFINSSDFGLDIVLTFADTKGLRLSNFGFDIPTDVTPTGVEVTMSCMFLGDVIGGSFSAHIIQYITICVFYPGGEQRRTIIGGGFFSGGNMG